MQHSEHIRNLSNYRLDKAEENLKAAKVLLNVNHYSDSVNRSYYAIFHSLRALLAFDEFDSKKHSGIISFFNKYYVKENKFHKKYSIILNQAFTVRNKFDYDDFYIVSKQDAEDQIINAEIFIEGMKAYISTIIS